jgi:putative phosphoribosyl transferase
VIDRVPGRAESGPGESGMTRFRDRAHAGRVLAERLRHYADRPDVVVLGLPRGGVPVAAEVSERLHVPLDVFVVRKLGVPGHEELAMGAIAPGGVRIVNHDVIALAGLTDHDIEAVTAREEEELRRRERAYRGDRPPPDLRGRTVILVDDGLATGATMRAAAAGVRHHGAAAVIVAVPAAAADTCEELRADADEVVCVMTPEPFHAVGLWYDDFSETTDDEVRARLVRSADPGHR